MTKTIIGKRLILKSIYTAKKDGRQGEYIREFLPDVEIIWEFTNKGILIVYYEGKESHKVPYAFLGGILIFDSSCMKTGRNPHEKYINDMGLYSITEEGGSLMLCEFNELTPLGAMPIIEIVPDMKSNRSIS